MSPLPTKRFDYELPRELIASYPAPHRTDARLMVVEREKRTIRHRAFRDIGHYFRAGDILILNDTRVMPWRLEGRREGTGGRVQVLLLREEAPGSWSALIKSRRPLREGDEIVFEPGGLSARVGPPGRERILTFTLEGEGDIKEWLETHGLAPLPPYIRRQSEPLDRERYQTVYAREPGAVAAPTAGLHFTGELLQELQEKGVEVVFLTLHVGFGTFKPIRARHIEEHVMEAEEYEISPEVARSLGRARGEGRRVLAAGSTTVRALEASFLSGKGKVRHGKGRTDLFIYPGFRFQVVDVLLTNFHLPRSTPLLLVAAFMGEELTERAYREALKEGYRFYSYGDAMLII